MEFQKGDLVQLKSGGKPMTVEKIESSGKVLCTWQVKGKTRNEAFDSALLTKADLRPLGVTF